MKQRLEWWVDVMDYLRRYRWVLLFVSIALPLVYGAYQFFWVGGYQISICYFPTKMSYQEYLVFQSRFFDMKNLERIVERLGDREWKEAIAIRKRPERLQKFVCFETWPELDDKRILPNLKRQIIPIEPEQSVVRIEILLQAREKEFLSLLAETIQVNLTEDLLLDLLMENLKEKIRNCRAAIADYQRDRARSKEEVQQKQKLLSALKNLPPAETAAKLSDYAVEFNVENQGVHLPLSMQIQALEMETLQAASALESKRADCERNERFLKVYERLLEVLKENQEKKTSLSLETYKQKLKSILEETREPDWQDLISAELREAENLAMGFTFYQLPLQRTMSVEQLWGTMIRLFFGSLLMMLFLIFCLQPASPEMEKGIQKDGIGGTENE
ncbi:MAG TPA: hypothetical protein PKY88_09740 [Anaerohalosphaeraceae bacterium]|nr:hypothetical protein [Anaerohalosphaeraceae bacterium]